MSVEFKEIEFECTQEEYEKIYAEAGKYGLDAETYVSIILKKNITDQSIDLYKVSCKINKEINYLILQYQNSNMTKEEFIDKVNEIKLNVLA